MRILTYNDPRNIEDIKEWDSISKYPQLCASQTLVQGLSRKCKRESFTVLSTIERFMKVFYGDWRKTSELSIKQYLEITDKINCISDEKIRNVFYKNRSEVIKAIKILIEADVEVSDLNELNNTKEFKEFYKLYTDTKEGENWNILSYSRDKGLDGIKVVYEELIIGDIKKEMETLSNKFSNLKDIKDINNKEIIYEEFHKLDFKKIQENKKSFLRATEETEYEIAKKRIDSYFKFISYLDNLDLSKIIIHGVHQFTPIIFRLIKDLENSGIEVIFLINYNREFSNIYKTWETVYEWTDTELEIDEAKKKNYSKGIANNFANMLLGNMSEISDENNSCTVFENMTEFGNYVAGIYEKAKEKCKSKKNNKNSEVLSKMSEQFYSVNGEKINNLLSAYFPEQFGDKHFLSYPIGQFILGLYNLWDWDNNTMTIDDASLKECLSLNIWIKNEEITPIEIYYSITPYLTNIYNIDDYINEINRLIEYSDMLRNRAKEEFTNYRHLAFFNLDTKYIEIYRKIILDLKSISEKLFMNKTTVNLKRHFKELLDVINDRIGDDNRISTAEYKIVKELISSLEIQDDNTNTSIKEVSSVLHFYLNEKSEDDTSNWIVRDFEQIDGGVFLGSRNCKERRFGEVESIYHYAEVCDSNMNTTKKNELPWPLDEDYFRQTNEAINLYLLCNSEYTNFLKWSLFYGMYYLDRQVKISYIKNTTNDIDEELYSIFKLLNTIEKPYSTDDINESFKEERKKKNNINLIKKSNFDKNDGRKMSFCKRRFYYEGLIDGLGTYSTEFLCKRYIKVLMLLKVTEEINYRRCWNNVDHIEIIINKRLENLKKLIPAWSREVSDVKAFIIKNLKVYREKVENGIYNIDKPYFEIKKNFIDMKFTEIIDGVEERVCVDKCESVYNYNIQVSKIIEFINEGGGSEYSGIMLEKCRVCKYGDICSRYYRERG